MKDNLTNEESLALITRMISTAKGNVGQGAFHMLLWGWVVMAVSLSHFLLLRFEVVGHPEIVWLSMIPTLVISLYVGFKKGRKERVQTHLDTLYMWIWLSFVIIMSLMLFFIAGNWHLVNPMVLLLAGYATFLSGKIIRFRPMVLGGISFWAWAVLAYFVGPYYGMLVTSAAITTGYIIPGILLQRKTNES